MVRRTLCRTILIACVASGTVLPFPSFAEQFTSSSYQVFDPVLNPANFATSSTYQLWSTMSEILGTGNSSSYQSDGGSLRFLYVVTPPVNNEGNGGGNTGGAGGGGGGGGGSISPGVTNQDTAVFKGLAYPGSKISLLKNGIVVSEVPASPNGTFEIHVRDVPTGVYTFSVRAEDPDHLKSTLISFTVYVSPGITTVIDGIFIPPTLTTDKVEVKRGDVINLLGKAPPDSTVTISIHSEKEIIKKTQSDKNGAYFYKLDSYELEMGDHASRSRAQTPDDISSFSDSIHFAVGATNRSRSSAGSGSRCDLNGDARVNILDYSIMAYWYKRSGFPIKVDLNGDGKTNLADFSILAYCWTG